MQTKQQAHPSSILTLILNFLCSLIQLLFPSKLKVDKIRLKIPSLNPHHPLKIIHLSDFHYDWSPPFFQRVSPHLLNQTIQIVNKEEPDLILLTGDFVQWRAGPITELAENYLSKYKAKYGVFACLGNHDYKESNEGTAFIKNALESVGIKVLMNECVFPLKDKSFELIGVGDYFSHNDFDLDEAFKNVDERNEITRVLLSHNPDSANDCKKWKVDLQLSGHTHGGQIGLPILGPILPYVRALCDKMPEAVSRHIPGKQHLYVVKNMAWLSGLHTIKRDNGGTNHLYINRGLATHPPCRLCCPPELTIFELYNPEEL